MDGHAMRIVKLFIAFSDGSDLDIHSLFALAENTNPEDGVKGFFKAFIKEWNEIGMYPEN
jgi:hypothetical protein